MNKDMNTVSTMCLNELKDGESGCVAVLDTSAALRARLRELGLIEGTRVTKVCTAFSGTPCAYNIRGAIIALRGTDTKGITVAKCME